MNRFILALQATELSAGEMAGFLTFAGAMVIFGLCWFVTPKPRS
jgi:hypothetical protein